MLLTHDDIRSIDGLRDPAGVLSVYVNGRRGGDRLARGLPVASALRDVEREAAASPSLACLLTARLEALRPRLVALLRAPAAGQALFAPLSGGEPLELFVDIPVEPAVALEASAYVRPLVAALDEARPAGVVEHDGGRVRVREWRPGALADLADLPAEGEPAAAVTAYAGLHGWRRLLVAGGADARELALRLRPGDCEVRHVAGPLDDDVLARELDAAQRDYERGLVERALDAALFDQRAVLGLERVLLALEGGRVEHLLFDAERDQRWAGPLASWRPRRPAPDPLEHLVERALARGADITPLEGGSGAALGDVDGVAAFVR